MKYWFSSICLLLLLCSASAQETSSSLYFSTDELPNLIKCLPAPPDNNSPEFKYDIQRYQWGKQQRKNAERAAMAKRDAVWTYEALIAEFCPAFGLSISKDATPGIWALLDSSLQTIDQIRVAPKAYFHRQRPFEYFREPTFTGEDDIIRGEGSYPSGHTIRSWLVALLLAEVNPAAANALYERAWLYGDSRVIAGAHWQSDVDASRNAASIGYSRLQTSPAFRADMEKAKEEFLRLAFVHIPEAIPDVLLDIRYYSTFNFVGARVDGYLAPTAIISRQAADSLRVVSDELKAKGYLLKIFDAYRPQCAVDHFVRWAEDVSDTTTRRYFYPMVDKSQLFDQQYIMKKSGHTRGSTVDLTLFDLNTEKDVDMGGTFDWFGDESHPDFKGITPEQYANRMILREAMLRHGFKPIDSEWWHFTLCNEPFPDCYFNFPVQ
ncbi:MAG: phosphatase PAP2 family protein [Bacteroidales bacterium]|nr:phosphatase PAP2 family protein [Bacteroidales bacterium]